ncbi:MAG: 6-phosphogluconolactonase [Nanoarchaeota archaeon]
MEIKVFNNKKEASNFIADLFLNEVKLNPKLKIGFATGKTYKEIYKRIIYLTKKRKVDLSKIKIYQIDEYLNTKDKYFTINYLKNYLIKPLNLNKNQVHTIKESYNFYKEHNRDKIDNLDFIFLGVGEDSHIAFNEPGSYKDSKVRIIKLLDITRKRKFRNLNNSPKLAITIGIKEILDSKKIVLAAFGKDKSKPILNSFSGKILKQYPASFLQKHKDFTLVLDKAAKSERFIKIHRL